VGVWNENHEFVVPLAVLLLPLLFCLLLVVVVCLIEFVLLTLLFDRALATPLNKRVLNC
jgi:hypothetical protein